MGNQTSGYFLTYKSAVEGPEYDYHPDYNQSLLHSDYTGFYVGIAVAVFVAVFIIVLNLVLGCCSPWDKYWKNRHSGNRLILPLFVSPPKDQTPILI